MPITLNRKANAKSGPPVRVTIPALLGLPVLPNKPIARQSGITAKEDCDRKELFQWAFGIRPVHRSSAMDTGSYSHNVLHVLSSGGNMQDAIDRCAEKYQAVIADLAQLYDGDPKNIPPGIIDDRTKDLNVGIAMGVEAWGELQPRLDKGLLELVGTELPFDQHIDLPDGLNKKARSVHVRGQMDFVFRDKSKRFWPLDFKSAGRGENLRDWGASADRRIQGQMYTEVLRQWAKPTVKVLWEADRSDIAGFLYLALAKPTITMKRGQKLESFIAEFHDWIRATGKYIDKADERRAEPPCIVQPVNVLDPLPSWAVRRILNLVDWQERALHLLENPEDAIPLRDFDPSEKHCRMGNMVCPYNDFCNDEQGRSWRETLSRRFTTRPDPLDSDPTRAMA